MSGFVAAKNLKNLDFRVFTSQKLFLVSISISDLISFENGSSMHRKLKWLQLPVSSLLWEWIDWSKKVYILILSISKNQHRVLLAMFWRKRSRNQHGRNYKNWNTYSAFTKIKKYLSAITSHLPRNLHCLLIFFQIKLDKR